MSLQLLNHLNGNNHGNFATFLKNFNNDNQPRIAWYPSAGTDFRALMYLSAQYALQNPAIDNEPSSPDIFIFSDYFQNPNFIENELIYQDNHTKVKIECKEELPNLNLVLHPEIVYNLEGNIATDRLIYLELKVESDTLGEIKFPVLYAFAENESFYCKKLIPNNALISHIIHVRYGGGCGGGGHASGIWLKHVLCKLKTELFISDDHFAWQSGDKFALKMCSEIPAICEAEFNKIRTIQGILWSNYGDVTWYKVNCSTNENSNLDVKKKKLFIPRKLSGEDSRYKRWNKEQPIKEGKAINQYTHDGKKIGYWEGDSFKGKLLGYGNFNNGNMTEWTDLSPKYTFNDKTIIIKKMGDIFKLDETDYSLVFGHTNSTIANYASWAGFTDSPFEQKQPVFWPNNSNRLVKFLTPELGSDEELRKIIHNWLNDANKKGKKNLATNGINNPLQPTSYIHPEFEMRQYERARFIETSILSWCKFNDNCFESIKLISMDPDFLEI
jgi:hypothetical protein